jgi:uncharacterized protein (TIGR02246 family)
MRHALAALVFMIALPATAAPSGPDAAVHALLETYVRAWDRADARALGAQFAADGDFINPTGTYARGPAQVEAFYAAAFAAGYAGSRGAFRPVAVRDLAPGVIAVDGEWSIEGARGPDGAQRPTEAGIAAAVLVRRHGVWRIALLREQAGAQHIRR